MQRSDEEQKSQIHQSTAAWSVRYLHEQSHKYIIKLTESHYINLILSNFLIWIKRNLEMEYRIRAINITESLRIFIEQPEYR